METALWPSPPSSPQDSTVLSESILERGVAAGGDDECAVTIAQHPQEDPLTVPHPEFSLSTLGKAGGTLLYWESKGRRRRLRCSTGLLPPCAPLASFDIAQLSQRSRDQKRLVSLCHQGGILTPSWQKQRWGLRGFSYILRFSYMLHLSCGPFFLQVLLFSDIISLVLIIVLSRGDKCNYKEDMGIL